ncbi:MAG: hypothetical protein RQ847_00425 [Wenzhouxiangellaceae bacterium]|nr:hypothetical protein [Wenzhouxiangellaceae bacterium]
MLPITHHRIVHVPHGIALIAALVALIAALGWQKSEPVVPESQTAVSQLATAPAEQDQDRAGTANVPETPRVPQPAPHEPQPRGRGGNLISELIPLVLPGVPDH